MKPTISMLMSMMFIFITDVHAQDSKPSTVYFTIGMLRGGDFNGTLNVEEFGIQAPYRLYYPDNTEILLLGFSGALNKSGWLHGFFNLGAPLRDVRGDLQIGPEVITDRLHVATMYTDFGLSLYPLAKTKRDARFQPFVQGGLGFYVVADSWWVILLLGLTPNDASVNTNPNRAALNERFDGDWLFSYGGGIDYYFLKNTGLKLSFRKLKLNLPGQKGSFNPLEVNVGITGKF